MQIIKHTAVGLTEGKTDVTISLPRENYSRREKGILLVLGFQREKTDQCSVSFCLLGGAHSALCAHRVEAGKRVGAQGMETPRYSSCVF